jgi:hypothetical protein
VGERTQIHKAYERRPPTRKLVDFPNTVVDPEISKGGPTPEIVF